MPSTMPASHDDGDVLREIENLKKRVAALESSRGVSSLPSSLNGDPVAQAMMVRAVAAGFRCTTFKRCPDEYYDQTMNWRRRFLGAASTRHLTKSLVLRNTRHSGEHSGTAIDNAEFVCVVLQYGRSLDMDAVAVAINRARADRGLPSKCREYRLAADCLGVSGYEPNAVTPLGLATPMPIFVDQRVANLVPERFWLGGGEVSLKWRVEWPEFQKFFKPIIAPCSAAEGA